MARDDEIDGAYQDGLDDALFIVQREFWDAENSDRELLRSIERRIRREQGYVTCVACKGTGDRAPTQRDVLLALLPLAGAHVSPTPNLDCRTCGGIGLLSPQMARPHVAA